MAKQNFDSTKFTQAIVRMYRMGTGDCFIIKFIDEDTTSFTMMIDCGTWSGSKAELTKYIEDIQSFVNGTIDLLVVTHEHKDHVYGFEACQEIFLRAFSINEVWFGWSENEQDPKVKEWKAEYGEKRRAIFKASEKFQSLIRDEQHGQTLRLEAEGKNILSLNQHFSAQIEQLADLHSSREGTGYIGNLKGMAVVKENFTNKVRYLLPGEIISNLPGASGVKFYVLGPPELWKAVKTEHGNAGSDTYHHNKVLSEETPFSLALLQNEEGKDVSEVLPFDQSFLDAGQSNTHKQYLEEGSEWRKIDYDWLFNSGILALRINSLTNNLSVALAIEFEDSGRVLLFPGDAEFGSWASWHQINWNEAPKNSDKHLTEDLLNRTVFYKVAHHLSHNGTAKKLGLEMMTHPDLVAMATLDYSNISSGWKSTMPNRNILKELLFRTKGRVMITNEEGLIYDHNSGVLWSEKIEEAKDRMTAGEKQDFEARKVEEDLYIQYTVRLI